MGRSRRAVLVAASGALVVAVALVYAPLRHAGYFALDDRVYVTDNPFVRDGLSLAGLRHAFLASQGALWMPLAFMSHMLDVQLFGLAPGGPHVVNVALHATNAVLLLWLLVRATGAIAPSIAVAALFAIHPLRVESVAWIAERKDVLSGFFGLLTLHAWVGYVRRPSVRRYALVVAGTVLALLSKPMLVTLPVVLLLLDLWPLGRLGAPRADGAPTTLEHLVMEKVPLLALAGGTAVVTLLATRADASLAPLDAHPLGVRIAHALVAYVWYVGKTVWPTDLAVFYPLPAWPPRQVLGATFVLVLGAVLGATTRRRAPWIGVGLLWFAVGLFPVIGLFQAGNQGMADRFTYLPGIGLLIAIAWTLEVAVRSRAGRASVGVAVALAALVFAGAARSQAALWTDSVAVFEHALTLHPDDWVTHTDLGNELIERGRYQDAEAHLREAILLHPRFAKAHFGLGLARENLGHPDEAIAEYREAIAIDPTFWLAHNNLGILLLAAGDVDAALHHFLEAARLHPGSTEATKNLRLALQQSGFAEDQVDGYLHLAQSWAEIVAIDRSLPGGEPYSKALPGALLGPHTETLRGCLHKSAPPLAPFDIYVAVEADGAVAEVTAVPPTRVARCFSDELRAAHAPAPPFAPFHAQVSMRFEG